MGVQDSTSADCRLSAQSIIVDSSLADASATNPARPGTAHRPGGQLRPVRGSEDQLQPASVNAGHQDRLSANLPQLVHDLLGLFGRDHRPHRNPAVLGQR